MSEHCAYVQGCVLGLELSVVVGHMYVGRSCFFLFSEIVVVCRCSAFWLICIVLVCILQWRLGAIPASPEELVQATDAPDKVARREARRIYQEWVPLFTPNASSPI